MSKITRRNFLKVTGAAAAAAALAACGAGGSANGTQFHIAVPNDTTNEARALRLLEKNGFFTLSEDAGITATKNDIVENPYNVVIDEVEAAQVPNVLQDEDYAVINSNYAIPAGLDPMTQALAMEDGTSDYVNVLVCKEGNQELPLIKALAAALQSQQVKDYMAEQYKGAVVSVVENPTDGYDPTVDYEALNGQTISCAATPAPTAKCWRCACPSWRLRASPWISRSLTIISSPTRWWRTARWTPTTSSTSPTWTTSMSRTAPTW